MKGLILTVELSNRLFLGYMYNWDFWAQCRWQNRELKRRIRGLLLLHDLHIFPSWKRSVELKRWELAMGERGQLEVKDENETMPLVDRIATVSEVYGAVPAALKT